MSAVPFNLTGVYIQGADELEKAFRLDKHDCPF